MEENSNNEKVIQTIYSIFQMPDDEIYAPSFQDGETVIVIRWPYTNNCDFPILKVNNKHRESIAVLGQAKGVAGVSISTIMRLGADYGGDTAIILPYRKMEGDPQPKEMPEQPILEVDTANHPPHYKSESGMVCDNVAFGHFRGAMAVLNQLDEILKDCGVVYVKDLYDLVGLPVGEQGTMLGWTNLNDAKIISDDDELWFIKLPPVERLCGKADEEKTAPADMVDHPPHHKSESETEENFDMECDTVVFGHFRGAMAFLNQLKKILEDYGVVYENDLYVLIGLPAIEQGTMYGWTNLDGVKLVGKDDGNWHMELPPVELLCGKTRILQQSKKKQEVRSMDRVAMHKALCTELNNLYARKNADYGDSFHLSYMEEGMAMARIRLADKMNRFKALTRGNSQKVNDESIRDTLIDLANYALMTVLEIDLENADPTSKLERMIKNKERTLEVMKNGLEADDE